MSATKINTPEGRRELAAGLLTAAKNTAAQLQALVPELAKAAKDGITRKRLDDLAKRFAAAQTELDDADEAFWEEADRGDDDEAA